MKLRACITALYAALLTSLLVVSPVYAGSMALLGAGKKAAATGPVTWTFVAGSFTGSSVTGSTQTFSNVPIGTAFTTRRVVIVFCNTNVSGGPVTSATIGGVLATIHVDQSSSGGGGPFAIIFSADVPTGTTATAVINYTGAQAFGGFVDAYTIDDSTLLSTTPNVSTALATSSTSVVGSSVSATSGGAVIGGFAVDSNVASVSVSPYTLDDFTGSTVTGRFSGTVGSTGSITPTASWASSTASSAIGVTTWR